MLCKGKQVGNITFNELAEEDFKLLQKWLNADFVKKWCYKSMIWSDDVIIKMFAPYVLKEMPVNSFTISYDEVKIGYIQSALLVDFPDYYDWLQIDGEAIDVSLMFIGEKEYIHKGLGSLVLKKFVDENVFNNVNINKCIICPEPTNIIAIKSYEKIGFKYTKTIQIPGEGEPYYVMELPRDKI